MVKLARFAALALLACAGSARAQSLTLDRTQTLEQILANCDRATGLPRGVVAPPQTGPRRRVVINPDWLKRPDAKDIAAFYPARAVDTHAGGKATIKCQVGVDGRLHDCAVAEEAPEGLGFGAAALSLTQFMVFVPRRVDCEPVDGALVTIPIAFGPR